MLEDNNKYFLGIDGGGTKTAITIINEKKEIVFSKIVGASAIDTIKEEDIFKTINDGLKEFDHKVDSIFAGIGGIATSEDIIFMNNILKRLIVVKEDTLIDSNNDVYNALYGGLDSNDGIILIAGTGSVAFGKNKNNYFRCGGYCYQEGDPGSSFDLGRKALKHLAKVIDKRIEESEFSKELMDYINVHSYGELAKYFINTTRTETASLAKIVTKNSNDKYAKKIIEDAINETFLMIKTTYQNLNFDKFKIANLCIIGGLGNAPTLYRDLLLKRIHDELPFIQFKEKIYEPNMGSALKAMENFYGK